MAIPGAPKWLSPERRIDTRLVSLPCGDGPNCLNRTPRFRLAPRGGHGSASKWSDRQKVHDVEYDVELGGASVYICICKTCELAAARVDLTPPCCACGWQASSSCPRPPTYNCRLTRMTLAMAGWTCCFHVVGCPSVASDSTVCARALATQRVGAPRWLSSARAEALLRRPAGSSRRAMPSRTASTASACRSRAPSIRPPPQSRRSRSSPRSASHSRGSAPTRACARTAACSTASKPGPPSTCRRAASR
jgi:hypothetical protein